MFILADDAGGDSSSVGDGGDDGEYIFFVRQHLVLVPISRCHSPPPPLIPPRPVLPLTVADIDDASPPTL